ncbi:MAG: cytochrome c oxidase subunit II [Deltaproteobacteria bacterium]|nr:cytochrome c oxidase subunit II [Deltaproteobacteria bacterium]NCP03708.1 cytochrome c oxidase subunit II [Deltaproteobacteria bacterium]
MNPLNNPTAQGVDNVLIYIFGVSLLLLAGITIVMIWFVVRYRRSKYPEPTSERDGSWPLEITWTLLPTLIVLTMFWYGWVNYKGLRAVPEGALEVEAIGRMWSWQFKYDNGRTSPKLYIPSGVPIKVKITAKDVLHSFFMPAFRIKRDAVPGMENYVWFQAPENGSYDIFCAEYCGTGHADMITTAEALSQVEFDAWYKQSASGTPEVARGRQLLEEQGCLGCHSFDGSNSIAPVFAPLRGQQRELTRNGEEINLRVDANYLRRAIRAPGDEVVEGFAPMMPAYGDEISESDLEEIVRYLLDGEVDAALDGGALLEEQGCLGCHSTDGSQLAGPSFKGLGTRTTEIKRNGEEFHLKVDEDYLRRAIREPNYEIVEDYPPIMPAFDQLTEAEVQAIIQDLLKR